MKNYYDILEINETASNEVIKAAYKALVKKYHPDNNSNVEIQSKMMEINEAYETLSDEVKRKKYDIEIGKKSEESLENNSFTKDTSMEKQYQSKTTSQENDSLLGNFFKDIGNSLLNSFYEKQQQFENAYLEGCSLQDYQLVRKFMRSTGYKRNGYAKALEERGFLKKDSTGKLVPTYKMKYYI